jgi:hypothetical protein
MLVYVYTDSLFGYFLNSIYVKSNSKKDVSKCHQNSDKKNDYSTRASNFRFFLCMKVNDSVKGSLQIS